MAVFALASILIGFSASSAPSTIQDMVPSRMRGRAVAIYLLISSITGTAFGPTAVALLTDYLFHDDAALPYSLALASVPACLLGLVIVWTGLKSYDTAIAGQRKALMLSRTAGNASSLTHDYSGSAK
jgi:MFS family permease